MPNLNNLTVQDLQWGTANWSGQGYIDGLKMVWNSATSISVTSGAAFIPALNKCLPSLTTLTLSGLSLTASTWYHVYLYSNAGTPVIECVTTAPDVPYNGTARTKTGDTSRRYIGSVRTDASGNILQFTMQPSGLLRYANGSSGTFQILASGASTTAVDVDCSGFIPSIATLGYFRFQCNGGTYTFLMPGGVTSNLDMDLTAANGVSFGIAIGPARLGNGTKVAYQANDTSSKTYIWVMGYYIER